MPKSIATITFLMSLVILSLTCLAVVFQDMPIIPAFILLITFGVIEFYSLYQITAD